MSIDLTRDAFQPAKQYTQVRLQQGRVILDDDWNEAEAITAHERTESLVDVIGPSGTSDDALLVSGVSVGAAGEVDFDLGGGTFYVGGRRVRWPEGRRYRFQDSFFGPPIVTAPAGDRNDLVWCEVVEQVVTSVEDAELLEVGLGGPDTATRTRLVARVLVETDVEQECEKAFEATVGAGVDERGVLTTDTTVSVGFTDTGTPADLCTPAVDGGYLSHLNQAIRVQCTDSSHFTWSFDNASSLYRVDLLPDRQTVKFRGQPVDDAHWPRSGQVVELLPWAAVLPNGQLQAAASGLLAVVDEPYDPDSDLMTLDAAVGAFGDEDWLGRPDEAELEADGRYVYLRVWERGDDTTGPELSFTAGGGPVKLGTTGIEVSFAGTTFRRGDHWVMAARPAEPLEVVPWDFADGRAPHGPVRLRAPLATIRWRAGAATIHDCRRRFRPLTELQGCCDITVGDGNKSFGDVESIQRAVDLLPPEGGRVCVRSGVYDERVVIRGRRNVEVHGCGSDTVVAPSAGGPVFEVDGSEQVTLRSMSLVATDAEGVLIGADHACRQVTLRHLDIDASPAAPGIRVASARRDLQLMRGLVVDHCRVGVRDLDAPPREGTAFELWPAIFVQGRDLSVTECRVTAGASRLTGGLGGIQVGGISRDVVLARNLVAGGNGHGITLGSVVWVVEDDLRLAVEDYAEYLRRVKAVGWLVWFDGGCIHVGGDPRPDPDGGDPPLVPLSVGPVEDVVIEENQILGMAADGIGVARFFEPAEGEAADIVTVERARIDRNHIEGNRRTATPAGSARLARLSGQGGIALAEAIDLRVRDNRILGNGRSEADPTCGLFVLSAEALLVTGNDIADNGLTAAERGAVRLGNRGGIVVRTCRGGPVGRPREFGTPPIGALLVHGNRVSQPVGQAVWALGMGSMSVHDNQLSAGNLGTTEIVAAILRMIERDFSNLGEVASLALTHVVGLSVTMLNLGLPLDVVGLLGHGTVSTYVPGMYAVATTPAALKHDVGRSAYEDAASDETEVSRPVDGVDDVRRDTGVERLLQGGHVSFDDNQVTLDLVDEESSLALCSVLLASFDDVAMHDDQIRCLTNRDLVVVDAVALALWSLRASGNRLQEIRARWGEGGLGTILSLLTWALMNVTTGNICSAPHVAGALTSALLVDEQNLEVP